MMKVSDAFGIGRWIRGTLRSHEEGDEPTITWIKVQVGFIGYIQVGLLEHQRHAQHSLVEVDSRLPIGADEGDMMHTLRLNYRHYCLLFDGILCNSMQPPLQGNGLCCAIPLCPLLYTMQFHAATPPGEWPVLCYSALSSIICYILAKGTFYQAALKIASTCTASVTDLGLFCTLRLESASRARWGRSLSCTPTSRRRCGRRMRPIRA